MSDMANPKESRIEDSFPDSSPVGEVEPCDLLHPYGVGIDCHSKFIAVVVLFQDADRVMKTSKDFSTDWVSLCRAKEFIQRVINEESFHYTIESTSTYHFPVLRCFLGEPHVVNPILASPTRRKTDTLDALLLARQDMSGMWPSSFIPDDDVQSLRVLLASGAWYAQRKVRASNRISNICQRFGHTFPSLVGSVASSAGRAIVDDLLTIDSALLLSGEANMMNMSGVSPLPIPDSVKPVIQMLLDEYDYCKKEQAEQHKKALRLAKSMMWVTGQGELISGKKMLRLLMSTPAVGEKTALHWLSQIVTSTRFPNAKAIAAFAGCDPSLKVSAGKVTSYSRRGGDKILHRSLMQAASGLVIRHKEPLGQWGWRISKGSKRGGFKKACGAVARRIATALYHIMRTGTPFSYDKYQFWQPIPVIECSLADMCLPPRVYSILAKLGFTDSTEVVKAYQTSLAGTKGVGEKCLEVVKKWIQNNRLSVSSSEESLSGEQSVRSKKKELLRKR